MSGVDFGQLPGGSSTWNAQNPPAMSIVNLLLQLGSKGGQFDPALAAQLPEGSAALLQSMETGKFGPGFERVQQVAREMQQAFDLTNRVLAL